MFGLRITKRPTYSTLRAIGREMISQWPTRINVRNDVQRPAATPGADVAWPEGGRYPERATDRRELGEFLFGR